jgi:hypothetical protein
MKMPQCTKTCGNCTQLITSGTRSTAHPPRQQRYALPNHLEHPYKVKHLYSTYRALCLLRVSYKRHSTSHNSNTSHTNTSLLTTEACSTRPLKQGTPRLWEVLGYPRTTAALKCCSEARHRVATVCPLTLQPTNRQQPARSGMLLQQPSVAPYQQPLRKRAARCLQHTTPSEAAANAT